MGGRGAYTEGKQKNYVYETIDKTNGVKILVPIDKMLSHSMPAEAHKSNAYIILDKKHGEFRQYREFNENHLPILEIGYHFESGLSENGKNVFHVHEYSKPGIENRQKGRLMTPEEVNKYKKYFKGISQRQVDEYLSLYYRRRNR